MRNLSPFPPPHRIFKSDGITCFINLLHPSVKEIVDIMAKNSGCYMGVTAEGAKLYINNQPQIKISPKWVEDLKTVLADDVKEYYDIVEYRLLPERHNQIKSYYQTY